MWDGQTPVMFYGKYVRLEGGDAAQRYKFEVGVYLCRNLVIQDHYS